MPRKTRAELEVENMELREHLETIHDELSDFLDTDDDDEEGELAEEEIDD